MRKRKFKTVKIEIFPNITGESGDSISSVLAEKDGSVIAYFPSLFFDGETREYLLIDRDTGESITEFEHGLKVLCNQLRERRKIGKSWLQS